MSKSLKGKSPKMKPQRGWMYFRAEEGTAENWFVYGKRPPACGLYGKHPRIVRVEVREAPRKKVKRG